MTDRKDAHRQFRPIQITDDRQDVLDEGVLV